MRLSRPSQPLLSRKSRCSSLGRIRIEQILSHILGIAFGLLRAITQRGHFAYAHLSVTNTSVGRIVFTPQLELVTKLLLNHALQKICTLSEVFSI